MLTQFFEQLYVNSNDLERERKVLNYVKKRVDQFSDIDFRQNPDEVGTFDFHGYWLESVVMSVEVKVRDIATTDYDHYFISVEKYEAVSANIRMPHYIFYGFTLDRKIRVYDLRAVRAYKRKMRFTHKRSGKPMEQEVYCVPSNQYLFEFNLGAD